MSLAARHVAAVMLMALVVGACSPNASPTTSPSRPHASVLANTPSPTASPTPTAEHSRWTEIWGLDAVSSSFLVATIATCHGTDRQDTCDEHLSATQNGGRTWFDITPPVANTDTYFGTAEFVDPDHGWVYLSDCAGGTGSLLRTIDGGATWGRRTVTSTTCNAGAAVTPTFADALHGWLLHGEPTGASSDLLFSADGGKTWRATLKPQPTEYANAAGFTAPDVGWVSGWLHSQPALFRSNLSGASWKRARLALPPIARGGDAFPGVPTAFGDTLIEPVQIWSHRRLTVIFDRSDDGGNTWRRVRTVRLAQEVREPKGPFPVGWVGVASPEIFFISVGHGVVRSGPAGTTRRAARPGGLAHFGLAGTFVWAASTHQGSLLRVAPPRSRVVHPWPPSPDPLTESARPVGKVPSVSQALLGTPDGSLYLESPKGRFVFRVDPSSGHVLARLDLGHGGALSAVEADGKLWVLQRHGRERGRLLRLDPGPLTVAGRREVPRAADGLAEAGSRVWYGAGAALVAIDVGSGDRVATVRLGSRIDRLAGDAASGRVYLTLEGPVRDDQPPLLEVDGTTGAIIARAHAGLAELNGVRQLVPTPGGVWAAESSGMMGTLNFYAAADLAPAPGWDEGRDGRGQIYGTNAIEGSYASGHLFVGYPDGLTACVGPRTGRGLGLVGAPRQGLALPIVDVGTEPMAVEGSTLYAIDPSVACAL